MLGSAVREVLAEHGRVRVDGLGDGDDLYARGLTSHASVDVMLALEDRFGLEFPEAMLRRQTFASVEAICTALRTVGVGEPATP